jgi:2,3-bisphosphoglycerate-independent phosphoglycerate mutase
MTSQKNTFHLTLKNKNKEKIKILTIVMDGIGYKDPIQKSPENAIHAANTPYLNQLFSSKLFRTIKAHGRAVGLPSDDDMGNSEVGHNALGAGRVFDQGAKLVNAAIADKSLFEGDAWKKVAEREVLLTGQNTLHLCGLLSDGNVHSHIDHLFALIQGAKSSGVKKVRLHMLLDGRDVSPLSALEYVEKLDSFLAKINSDSFDCKVASGGGRTFVTMDRYESDWNIVERGYHAHVLGQGRFFSSLKEAIETLRKETNNYDQDLPPFVIAENKNPVGIVKDHDGFIFYNFRGDRAIEISRALTEEHFTAFNRTRFPNIVFAGMMQYDGDLKIPELFLVKPPVIDNTITELLSNASVKQFACSETQKYGHVTYFWNGNRSGKFNSEFEKYVEIPSDQAPFQERPWMKSAEIADETIKQMKLDSFEVGRINFANGDMVGHTGDFFATTLAVEAVDLALGRLMVAAKETKTILVITADHGNADEMMETEKKSKRVLYDSEGNPKKKTSHTLAPVPFILFNTEILDKNISLREAGLANVAATVLELAGFEKPEFYEPSLISN